MFIDIHVHVSRYPNFFPTGHQLFPTAEDLIARYDNLGIEKGVLLPEVNPEASYFTQSVEDILDICNQYPDRFVPFCNVDPRAVSNRPDAPLDEILLYYKNKGCKGIGEVSPNLPFLDPMCQNLFKHAEKAGMPIIFHLSSTMGYTYGLYDEPGLPQLEMVLWKFPALYFLGHSTVFWSEIAELETSWDRALYPTSPVKKEGVLPKLFRRYKNLLGDLSAGSGYYALARDPHYAVQFLTEFQDRLFFGTDICRYDTSTPLVDFLLDLRDKGKITEDVFKKIARENAVKLLGL